MGEAITRHSRALLFRGTRTMHNPGIWCRGNADYCSRAVMLRESWASSIPKASRLIARSSRAMTSKCCLKLVS